MRGYGITLQKIVNKVFPSSSSYFLVVVYSNLSFVAVGDKYQEIILCDKFKLLGMSVSLVPVDCPFTQVIVKNSIARNATFTIEPPFNKW